MIQFFVHVAAFKVIGVKFLLITVHKFKIHCVHYLHAWQWQLFECTRVLNDTCGVSFQILTNAGPIFQKCCCLAIFLNIINSIWSQTCPVSERLGKTEGHGSTYARKSITLRPTWWLSQMNGIINYMLMQDLIMVPYTIQISINVRPTSSNSNHIIMLQSPNVWRCTTQGSHRCNDLLNTGICGNINPIMTITANQWKSGLICRENIEIFLLRLFAAHQPN